MTEDMELQAKIAALRGKIHEHKQHQHIAVAGASYPRPQYSPGHALRGRGGRWSPYGRGGYAGYSAGHKNRTLVLTGNGGQATASPAANDDDVTTTTPSGQTTASAENFVSTRARGKNQLMSKDTYEREQKQKQEQQDHLRAAKRQRAYNRETTKLMSAFKPSSAQNRHVITVDGIRFQLREDGSKLFRIIDGDTTDKETPKRTKVAGVEFNRTKNGNLVRAKAVKHLSRYTRPGSHMALEKGSSLNPRSAHQQKPRPQCAHFTKNGSHLSPLLPPPPPPTHDEHSSGRNVDLRNGIWSQDEKLAGNCPHGPSCRFTHDPSRVAICKTFLRTGKCPSGEYCDLSHEPSYHRVPACTHFLRGNCTAGDNCRYPHVHVSPTAPVCKPFATLGFCADGPQCPKRHVVECADYSNSGFCADRESGKCTLPHVDRAATLRKAADRQAKNVADDDDDDEEEESGEDEDEDRVDDHDMPDVDSDDADIIMGAGRGGDDDDSSVSQQRDYISFS